MNDPLDGFEQATKTRGDTLDLESFLEAFAASAPVDDPRRLLEFLPVGDSSKRRLVLVELIKLDMSEAAAKGAVPRIEWYVQAIPELLTTESVPLDLALEELQLRRESGEAPRSEAYAERFPGLANALEKLPLNNQTIAPLGKLAGITESTAGERIDDFTIIRPLGKGAFAQVYLARQESMQRLVALKVSQRSGDEPRALAQLQHPNIVRVYDHRQTTQPAAHLLYMQYVSGGTLADVLKWAATRIPEHRDGTLVLQSVDENLLRAAQPTPEASSIRNWLQTASWPSTVAWVGIQLARALEYADRNAVLHRDVKPANVLMSAEGIPKLADFNVSATGLSGRAGAAAFFGGSLAYMSPEQLRAADATDPTEAADLDGRSDIYSLGVLLWEMWQSHRPWSTDASPTSWSAAMESQRHLRNLPPHDCDVDGDASARVLYRVLLQTLRTDPAERPADGGELAGRLRLALFPNVANRFDPPKNSIASRLLLLSPWMLAALVILVPNALAGVFNFFYNEHFIIKQYAEMQPLASGSELPWLQRLTFFETLALVVNGIAFPAAVLLMLWYLKPLLRGLQQVARGEATDEHALGSAWNIGYQAATIGAAFWAIAGIVYPVALKLAYPHFAPADCGHFFLSLIMCGLVAWAYPFFGLTVITVLVYYPQMMRPTMKDPAFEIRARVLERRAARFLLISAGIPLLAAVLVLTSEHKGENIVTLTAVIATAFGLAAAFTAFQTLRQGLADLGTVLSPERPSPVPMPDEEL